MFSWPCLVCAGRAVGLSVGALVAGILLGAGLNAWLRVDIVPIGVRGADAVRGTSAAVCLPSCSAREGSWKLHMERILTLKRVACVSAAELWFPGCAGDNVWHHGPGAGVCLPGLRRMVSGLPQAARCGVYIAERVAAAVDSWGRLGRVRRRPRPGWAHGVYIINSRECERVVSIILCRF